MSQEMAKAVDQLFGQDPQDETSGSDNKGISFVKSRSEAAGFPKGWYREELVKSGVGVVNPGQKIIHYFSPDGRKFRTKAELARFFGVRLDLSNFDFRTGRIHAGYAGNSFKKSQQVKIGTALKNGSGNLSLVSLQKLLDPPVRQCTSVLSQRVRAIETCGPNVSCKDAKEVMRGGPIRSIKPRPVQVFWAKRLDGITAIDADSDLKLSQPLPRGFKAAAAVVSENAALVSLASAVYNASTPGLAGPDEGLQLHGQQEKITSNPGAYVHPYQPLISGLELLPFLTPFLTSIKQTLKVTPMLIEEQELEVQRLRQNLAKMLTRQQKERG